MPTAKDFVATAAIIREGKFSLPAEHVAIVKKWMAEEFAALYARQNPRFDRERFLIACGVQSPAEG